MNVTNIKKRELSADGRAFRKCWCMIFAISNLYESVILSMPNL